MPVELQVAPDRISVDELVKIYGLFCRAYGIEVYGNDERFLRDRGIQDLHEGNLDYRPYRGAKFFGQGVGNSTQFHGYSNPKDSNWKVKDERFRELVLQHFIKS